MFCSNCLTERCISIPLSGLKLDLSLGLHSLPLWSSSPLLFSRRESFLYNWGRRKIVSQAGKSGSSSSGSAVKSRNSIWRRDTVYSSDHPVEKVVEESYTSTTNSRRKSSAPARHAGGEPYSPEKGVSGKPQFLGRNFTKGDSFADPYKKEKSYGGRVESFSRVSDSVSSQRNASVDSAWIADTWHNTHGGRQGYGRSYSNLTIQSSHKTSLKQQVPELPVQGKKVQTGRPASFEEDAMNGQVGSLKRPNEEQNGGRRRKKKKYAAESEFRRNLDMCSKYGDLLSALDLYDRVIKEGALKLDQYAYNVLLYLCSSAALGALRAGKSANDKVNVGKEAINGNGSATKVESSSSEQDLVDDDEVKHTWNLTEVTDEIKLTAQRRGFEIYKHMQSSGVTAGEPTLTSVARLAVAVEDGDLAFEVIKEMSSRNIAPKLRSYGPALFTYCKLRQVDKAFEVYAHMNEVGVQPEEDELRALLDLSVSSGLEDKVYVILHRLRKTLRELSRATVEVFHQWFTSKGSDQVGKSKWDSLPSIQDIQQGIEAGGGGWHGLGWLGKGGWKTEYTTIDKTGRCRCCSEQLVTIDIDPRETESFAESLATIALSREARADFKNFQAWLDGHGPYDAIVDAANVGLLNQNFSEGGFNFVQVNAIVNGIQKLSPSKKLPLIVLHHKRTKGGAAATPTAQQFLQAWRRADTIFTTPTGSNDDWYWLYAAVKYKCLLVTNDEMRDHLFQLLGNDFFPKWKERHQVRFSISKKNDVEFHMPPPYSIVIQESQTGAYHFPMSGGDDIETPREWLCVSRPGTKDSERDWSLGETAVEDEMEECLPAQGDPLQPTTAVQKEETSEPLPVQDGALQSAALQDEARMTSLQVEILETSTLIVSSSEERAPEGKSSVKAKSPRSPRTPKSATESPQAAKTKVPKSSPRAKSKKATDSPTLKLLKLADKKAGSPVDFQI